MLVAISDELKSTNIGNLLEFIFDDLFFEGVWVGSINIMQDLCYSCDGILKIYQILFDPWDKFRWINTQWWFWFVFNGNVGALINELYLRLNNGASLILMTRLISLEAYVLLVRSAYKFSFNICIFNFSHLFYFIYCLITLLFHFKMISINWFGNHACLIILNFWFFCHLHRSSTAVVTFEYHEGILVIFNVTILSIQTLLTFKLLLRSHIVCFWHCWHAWIIFQNLWFKGLEGIVIERSC